MARIRTVKPEFWTSLTIAQLSRDAKLTFLGLLNYCDDEGRGVDDARLVKAAVWPLDDKATVSKVDRWLREIADAGPLLRYEVEGKRYLAFRSWREHQRVDKAKPSLIPPAVVPDDSTTPPADSTTPPGTIAEGSRPEGNGREQGTERQDLAGLRPVENGAIPDVSPNGGGDHPTDLLGWIELVPPAIDDGQARYLLGKHALGSSSWQLGLSDGPGREVLVSEYVQHPGPFVEALQRADDLGPGTIDNPVGWLRSMVRKLGEEGG